MNPARRKETPVKPKFLSLATALLLATAVDAHTLAAADKPASGDKLAAKPAKAAASKAKAGPSEEEAMKAWMAYATPGEPHKLLAKGEGTWAVKVKSWMNPSKPPEETDGTSVAKMVLGGRYLEEHFEGTAMGQPFSGMGTTGYDNYKKKYVATWIDSSATGIMTTTGTFDESGKVMTSWGTMDDPVAKKTVKMKMVGTWVDDDTHRFEMWSTGPGGKMHKVMEMVYTRKK
jgi:hypothetical protein